MRIRFLLVCGSAGLFAYGLAIQACGNTTDEGVTDAGADVAEAGADASGADANDGAPACDTTKDILSGIQDASIPETGTTTGICATCAKSKCAAELAACSKECSCQGLATDAIDCYMKSPSKTPASVAICGSKFVTLPAATRNIGIALFGCLNDSCPTECSTAALLDGGDGG